MSTLPEGCEEKDNLEPVIERIRRKIYWATVFMSGALVGLIIGLIIG